MRVRALCHEQLLTVGELLDAVGSRPLEAWLSDDECQTALGLRHLQSRELWLAGRWSAKTLLARVTGGAGGHSGCNPSAFFIQSRDERGRQMRPRVYYRGRLQPWSLSISHCHGWVFTGLYRGSGSIGVDVLERRAVNPYWLATWLTPAEQAWIEEYGEGAAARCWALKEAAYKALNRGEPFAPRAVEVLRQGHHEYRLCWSGLPVSVPLSIELRESAELVWARVLAGTESGECDTDYVGPPHEPEGALPRPATLAETGTL